MRALTGIFRDRGITLCIAWTFNQLAYAIVYPFIPIYLSNERGIPYSRVGLIFPLMGTMVVLSPMLFGPLTDKLGRRPMMGIGQFVRTAVFLVLAYLTYIHAPAAASPSNLLLYMLLWLLPAWLASNWVNVG